MKRRALAASSVVSFAIGCSLLTDLDGLADPPAGPDAAEQRDAAEPGLDAGAPDALVDGALPPSGCARYPDASFCVDFDRPNDLDMTTWTEIRTNQGTITATDAAAISAPSGGRLDLPSATSCSYVQLVRKFTGTFSSMKLRLSVRPENTGIFLAVIYHRPSDVFDYRWLPTFGPTEYYTFVQKHDQPDFSEFSVARLPFDALPFGAWHDVTFEYRAREPSLALQLDDRTFAIESASVPIVDPTLEIGPYCRDAPTLQTFDDIAVWLVP